MRKVIIRADASKLIGFGHFIRSLALAGYLKNDFNCCFCTFNSVELRPSEYQLSEIKKVANFISIEANDLDDYDNKFLAKLNGGEIIVLDNYYYSYEYQLKIKNKGCKLVYIDGTTNSHYVADVLLCAGEVTRSMFSLGPQTIFVNGLNHSFLRDPFLYTKNHPKTISKINSIVVAIGGADPFRLTDKLIKLILEVNPNINIEAIAGETVVISQELLSKVKIHRKLNAQEIVQLFEKVDIGFLSASTICIEAIACQLPIAAGWYVDNQKNFYKYGVQRNLFMPLGNLLDRDEMLKKYIENIFRTKNFPKTEDIDFKQGKKDIINIFKSL